MKYVYQETALDGSRFMFHGTGRELFKGFIKATILLGSLSTLFYVLLMTDDPVLICIGLLMYWSSMFAIIPMAIHGAVKYRMSRTSWRGIHFGYRGSRNEFTRRFYLDALLSLLTLGLYSAWMRVNIRKYTVGHLRFGNVEFRYTAKGSQYFFMHLKGSFFTLLTGGVYFFWYARNIFNFWVNHSCLIQEGRLIRLRSSATAGDMFRLIVPNTFFLIITLSLGAPWTKIRSINFIFDHILIEGDLDTNKILQTEVSFKDATGGEMLEMLEFEFA